MKNLQLMLVELKFTFQKIYALRKFLTLSFLIVKVYGLVKFPNSSISRVIGTIYGHPTKNIEGFTESLNDILSEMNMFHANYFILNDLNINTDKFAVASNYSSHYLNMLTTNSVASLITKSTKVTPSTVTKIDHILTNQNCLILTSFVIKYT